MNRFAKIALITATAATLGACTRIETGEVGVRRNII